MWPSRKWWAARVTALTGLAVLVANAGAWTQDATIMAITIVSGGALAWLLPNHEDPPPPAVLETRDLARKGRRR